MFTLFYINIILHDSAKESTKAHLTPIHKAVIPLLSLGKVGNISRTKAGPPGLPRPGRFSGSYDGTVDRVCCALIETRAGS